MNKTVKKCLLNMLKIVATVAVVLLLWWIFSLVANNELVLPTPWEVVRLTFLALGKGQTYLALLWTLLRGIVSFVVSSAFALALILLAGVWSKSKDFLDGFVTFFRALPTVAIILLAMIAFSSAVVPVVVAFLVAFPVVYSAFEREIFCDKQLLQMCKIYDVSKIKKVNCVLLPQIKQAILPQCKDTLPLCLKVVIAGEVLALPKMGLGKEMYVAKVNLLTAEVLALTVLVLVVCFAISGVFALLQRRQND